MLAAGCAHSLVRADVHKKRWLLVETEHISLRTDVGPDEARVHARFLELTWRLLASNYDRVAPGAALPQHRFAVIYLASCADYDQIAWHSSAGFSVPIDEEQVAITCGIRIFGGTPVHELAHLFNHHFFFARLPRWVDEGLADYYRTVQVDPRGRMVLGGVPLRTRHALRHLHSPPSLAALRALPPDRFYARDRELVNYACAWKLVHMLSSTDPARLARFRRYLAALRAGAPEATAWQQAFGDLPAGSLERAYAAYPDWTRVGPIASSDGLSPATTPRARPLRAGEAHVLWAGLLAIAHGDQVAGQLDAAEDADPDWPGLLYWRARLLHPPDDLELLRAYIARQPDDPRGWSALVRARLRRATVIDRDGLPVAQQDQLFSAAAEVKALIEHSSQPRALNTVAWYYALRRDPAAGLNFAMRAVQGEPSCADCWDTLALLYFEARKVDLAVAAQERAVSIYAEHVPGVVRSRLQLYRGARR